MKYKGFCVFYVFNICQTSYVHIMYVDFKIYFVYDKVLPCKPL